MHALTHSVLQQSMNSQREVNLLHKHICFIKDIELTFGELPTLVVHKRQINDPILSSTKFL